MLENNQKIELFTVQQLADFLHKNPATIYCDITRRPQSLPPIFRAPGSGKPLFVNPQKWVVEILLQGEIKENEGKENFLKKLKDEVNHQKLNDHLIKRGRPSNASKQRGVK